MNRDPALALLGIGIAGFIAWMHANHIFPFNSLLNDGIAFVVAVIGLFICMRSNHE